MKQVIGGVFLLLFLFGLSASALARPEDRKEDHEQLRALKTKVEDAFNKMDVEAIAANFTENFSVTTVNQTTLTSAAEIDAFFRKTFKSPDSLVVDLKVSPEADILTSFLDTDNGFCYGRNHEVYTLRDGRKVPMDSRWTAFVHRENGQWKIAALHAGVDFLNNPVLARSESRAKRLTLAGFAGGVALTLIGSLFFLRRKTAKD